MNYNHREIEKKWQKYWSENRTFHVETDHDIPKFYVLDMFPYPSGAGLHVGHPLGYIASDIYSRYKRHQGYNVLHPMGYDAYGLPAEQYAIQTGTHPAVTTARNIKRYREQLDRIGFSYDWDREVQTCDPKYYKWTQWTFIQLFKSWYNKQSDKAESIDELIRIFEKEGNKNIEASTSQEDIFTAEAWKQMNEQQQQEVLMNYRLAYLSDTMVNWCPALGTVLANDEVKDGFSERGGHPVERKLMKQWSLRISAYAQRLLDGLEKIDWFESLKEVQRNWIGRSEGAIVTFHLSPALSKGEGDGTKLKESAIDPKFYNTDSQMWSVLKDKARQMSKQPTEAESILWERLRAKQTGYKIRRQHVIDQFIVDFVCISKKTVIEIDGKIHENQVEADEARTEVLEKLGFSVIRFSNDRVVTETDEVLKEIKNYLDTKVLPHGEDSGGVSFEVFTTRPDTLWGATFMVLAPEHELLKKIVPEDHKDKVNKYINRAKSRSERDRISEVDKITGEFTGAYGINPVNGEKIPIWVADYVLAGYGTGAIMAVPAHDSRDFKFAKHFDIPIIQVVKKEGEEESDPKSWDDSFDAKEGVMINSGFITGKNVADGIKATIEWLEENELGEGRVNYRLRDAIFSRQRYWGEPFPIYYKDGMPYPLDESELPLELPEVDKYLPTESGMPPLARAKNWKTKEGYPLETNTMPGFAGSSGYYLRYMDPHNNKAYFSKEANEYWKDVDLYLGGDEHGTGHLIYARFWNMFLYDLGMVCEEEPFKKLINQGKIQGRSSIAYQLMSESYNDKSKIYFDAVLVSKDYVKIIKKHLSRPESLSSSEHQLYNQFYDNVKKIEKTYNITLNYGNFMPRNIPSMHVENDILDIESFIKDDEYKNSNIEFIAPASGFVCDFEIEKMSKTKRNVVVPDELVDKYGADTFRCYEMFLGPLETHKPWDTQGIEGVYRFMKKLWRLYHDDDNNFRVSDEAPTKEELKVLHNTIKKVRIDIERFSFNTVVSNYMICVNELTDLKCNKREILEPLAILLSPYASHMAEELWSLLGHEGSISRQTFPEHNEEFIRENTFAYPVSFNGKMRLKIELPLDVSKEDAEKAVLEDERTEKYLGGSQPKRFIFVPKKIINIVV